MKPFEEKLGSFELNEPPAELKQRVLENAASGAKDVAGPAERKRFARLATALTSKYFLFLVLPILMFGSVGVLALTIEERTAGNRWAEVQAKLDQTGENLDWKSFYPDPVPDAQNFMATPALLGTELRGPDDSPEHPINQRRARLKALPRLMTAIKPSQPESEQLDFARFRFYENGARYPKDDFTLIGDMEGSPEEAILRLIDADAALFEELAAAAKRPYSQPPTSIEDRAAGSTSVWHISRPHLQTMQKLAKITAWRAVAAARLGDRQKARESLEILFKCRDCINSEGMLIDGLVSMAIRAILERHLPDILREDCWTDQDLAWLQHKVSEGDGFEEGLKHQRGEMAHIASFYDEHLAMSKAERRKLFEGYAPAQAMLLSMMPDGIIQRNKATSVEWIYQYNIVPLEARDVTTILDSNGELEAEIESLSWFSFTSMLAAETGATMGQVSLRILDSEMNRRMMEVGVALERYHLASGTFPDSLDALVPEFVDAIPINLLGEEDEPLSYTPEGDGYHLSAPNVRYPETKKRKLDFFR